MEEKKDDGEEKLFIGNLWKYHEQGPNSSGKGRRCKNRWTMFLSTSPTDVIPPKTVMSVEYELVKTVIIRKRSPFLLGRNGWDGFDVQAKISFKNDRPTTLERYPLQSRVPLFTKSLSGPLQVHENKRANVDEILKRFGKKSSSVSTNVAKTGLALNTNLRRLKTPIHLDSFFQTPGMVVELMAMFSQAYNQPMPKGILRLIVDFATPCYMSLAANQAVVFSRCHGIDVQLRGKGRQVMISNCKDITFQVEDLMNHVEVSNSKKVDITTVGKAGVHMYLIDKSSDLRIRFRDDSPKVQFMAYGSNGLIQAAPFSKGEDLVEFKKLENIKHFPAEPLTIWWSQEQGWHQI